MVVFTCSNCGDSVKKPGVAKHMQTRCRVKDLSLTCMDCLSDFKGNEYEGHTKCLTEDERYSAKGQAPKTTQNKGEKKQQAWQECMQTALKKSTLKPEESELLRSISKFDNVPRKKAKFINFITNAFRQYANNNKLIERVWEELEVIFKVSQAGNESNKSEETQPKPAKQDPEQLQQDGKDPEQSEQEKKKSKKDSKKNAKVEQNQMNGESKQPEDTKSDVKQPKEKKKKSKQPKQVNPDPEEIALDCQQPEQLNVSEPEVIFKQAEQVKNETDDVFKSNGKPEEGANKKEKKRKRQCEEEKPIDGGAEAGKADSKQKKKKQKSVDEKVENVAEGNDDIDNNDENDGKGKKNNRKRKVDDSTQVESNNYLADQVEPGTKKKKKKRDKSCDNEILAESGAPGESEESPKIKKKRKKPSDDSNTNEVEAKDKKGDAATPKKVKKSKKSENKENIAGSEPSQLEEGSIPEVKIIENEHQEEREGEEGKMTPESTNQEENVKADQFDWKETILKILNEEGKNNRIPLQRLQKKVLKIHCRVMNCENTDKKKNRFMKKLKNMQEVEIENDFVVLKS